MKSFSDQALLREYCENRSEPAFAELVARHVDLVYSSALRIVRDRHLAEDVTQSVFLAVAQNAPSLGRHPLLPGWLHRTTQNLASNVVRQEVRRREREQKVNAMNYNDFADDSWERIEPYIDEALGTLRDDERNLVLLRFFRGKSSREIAKLIGISDGTAQKRINRAVEKVRRFLRNRSISIGAASLGISLSAHGVKAAPSGLAAAVTTAATHSILNHVATVSIAKGVVMSTTHKAIVAVSVAVAVGTGIYEVQQSGERNRHATQSAKAFNDFNSQLESLRTEYDSALRELATLRQDAERLKEEATEVHRLRSLVSELRRDGATTEHKAGNPGIQFTGYLSRIERLRNQFAISPHESIPEMQFIGDKEWLESSMLLSNDDAEAMEKAKAHLRTLAKGKFALHLNRALQKYLQASGGALPDSSAQLHEYFSTPVDAGAFQRYEVVRSGSTNNLKGTETVFREISEERSPFDTQFSISIIGAGYATPTGANSDRSYGFSYSFDDMPPD